MIFAHLSFVNVIFGFLLRSVTQLTCFRCWNNVARTESETDTRDVGPRAGKTAPSQPFFNRVRDFRLL